MMHLSLNLRLSRSKLAPMANGFTLLEVLISLSIFAVISVGAFSILQSSFASYRQSEQRMEQFEAFNRMLGSLESDLSQSIDRPIRDTDGDTLAAFIGQLESLEFTHGGWNNRPGAIEKNHQPAHSTLRRSAYRQTVKRTEEGGFVTLLSRQQWHVLDRARDSKAITTLSIPIDRISVSYLSHNRTWHNKWPALVTRHGTEQSLPRAIKLDLQTIQFGLVTRLFYVGDSPLKSPIKSPINSPVKGNSQ